jgi:hypothetical protein
MGVAARATMFYQGGSGGYDGEGAYGPLFRTRAQALSSAGGSIVARSRSRAASIRAAASSGEDEDAPSAGSGRAGAPPNPGMRTGSTRSMGCSSRQISPVSRRATSRRAYPLAETSPTTAVVQSITDVGLTT